MGRFRAAFVVHLPCVSVAAVLWRVRSGLFMVHLADALSTQALCGRQLREVRKNQVREYMPVTCRACRDVAARARFSFCESVAATGSSAWHIRILSSQGRFLGGGADTPALCGRVMAWDVDAPVTEETAAGAGTCARCRLVFAEAVRLQERAQPTPA